MRIFLPVPSIGSFYGRGLSVGGFFRYGQGVYDAIDGEDILDAMFVNGDAIRFKSGDAKQSCVAR